MPALVATEEMSVRAWCLQCALNAAELSTGGAFPPHCVHWKSWWSVDTLVVELNYKLVVSCRLQPFDLQSCLCEAITFSDVVHPEIWKIWLPIHHGLHQSIMGYHLCLQPHFAIKECISLMKRVTSPRTQWRLSPECAAGLGGSPWVMECMHIVWSGTKLQWLEVTNRDISQTPHQPIHCLHTIVHLLLLSFFKFFFSIAAANAEASTETKLSLWPPQQPSPPLPVCWRVCLFSMSSHHHHHRPLFPFQSLTKNFFSSFYNLPPPHTHLHQRHAAWRWPAWRVMWSS